MSTRPRVLVIAEAANPEWVSVPLIGWSLSRALTSVADVHLVTQVRNRDAILRAGLVEGQDFTAIDSEAVSRPFWKLASMLRMGEGKGWTMITAINALTYPYFEHLLWKRFGADIQAKRFDIVHRITPLTPTTISPLAARCAKAGVPFIMGPLNGGVPWPPGFDGERRREREWLSYVRDAYRVLPGRKRMYDKAAAILAGSRHTMQEIPDRYRHKTFWLPENAIDPARFNQKAASWTGGPLKAVFIGRLVPYKGADMLLEAARPFLADGSMTLDIIGDGPMRATLEEEVNRAKIQETVTFHGMLDHQKVQDVAARTHILTFPSIREFGGGVVLEAMALGVVPVVIDYAGPGELVDETTGYLIPIGPREKIVRDLGEELAAIQANPSELYQKSKHSREKVRQSFTWEAKSGQIRQIYDWVLGTKVAHPEIL